MKNEIYLPTKRTRLRVYKQVLEFIKKGNKEKYGLIAECGLCMLLPCFWLGTHYMEQWKDKKGNEFSFGSAPEYFPEFAKYYSRSGYQHNIPYRISILNKIIKSMS